MTQNLFNQDIGDLPSMATVQAPVVSEASKLAAQQKVQDAQTRASLFSQAANVVLTAGPVIQEMAGSRWADKNLVGTEDPDISDRIKTEVSVGTEKEALLANEVTYQQRINAEDLNTLRELEAAREQGLISYEELQQRAQVLRNNAINRAPLFKEQTDSAFRAVTGTSTGTGAISAAISPWQMTPEEEAFQAERKANAAFAAELNVDLPTADKLRADLKQAEISETLQPSNEAEFSLWTEQALLGSRANMNVVLLKFTDETGAFQQDAIPMIRQNIETWEQQTIATMINHVADLQEKGVVVSPSLLTDYRENVQAQGDAFRAMLEDNDQALYATKVATLLDSNIQIDAMKLAPNVAVLKELGVNAVDLIELGITQGEYLTTVRRQNPLFDKLFTVANMDAGQLGAATVTEALQTVMSPSDATTTSTDQTVSEALMPVLNSNVKLSEDLYTVARSEGTLSKIYEAYQLAPEGIVHLQKNSLWENPLSYEELQDAFGAAATGIQSALLNNKTVVGASSDYGIWITDQGKVEMRGNGVNEVLLVRRRIYTKLLLLIHLLGAYMRLRDNICNLCLQDVAIPTQVWELLQLLKALTR